MQVEFEYAKLEDLEKIVGTYNSTVASKLVTADLEPVSVESKRQWFLQHNESNRPLWKIMCDGEYAGWMSFNSFYGRPAYAETVELSIYLESNFRNKGLGKMCLQKAIAEAQGRNIRTLLGFIFSHNVQSVRLFEAFDFKVWGHLPEVANMQEALRDLLILGRKI